MVNGSTPVYYIMPAAILFAWCCIAFVKARVHAMPPAHHMSDDTLSMQLPICLCAGAERTCICAGTPSHCVSCRFSVWQHLSSTRCVPECRCRAAVRDPMRLMNSSSFYKDKDNL